MPVAIVVPWRGGCPHRERAWQWVRDAHRDAHPAWEIVMAKGGDPWVKAVPVCEAISRTQAETIIIADADVWSDGLLAAVDEVQMGAPWAMPHRTVFRLDELATQRWYAGERNPEDFTLTRSPYFGMWGGGFVVASREVLESIPFDARYEGWGQEDESLGLALHALVGPAWRGEADLIHLWHPPAPRVYWRTGSYAGGRLAKRYRSVRNDPAGMRRLVEEGRCSSN